ncbi:cobalt-precorrin-5B (C(1))-methyltransferase [Entomobacter blattae]|uniref:Cobalt-precorrin-5B C(1)-methyltransferase n=1 Tax=Entomobacter blattae TaxID=2762277 RepID=A0A7H1NQ19_9PROT|nr:cobalt-precorrin-5B (C(1))-methyltransferase [Entomobacter blattae]QNT77879.1 Cobalt-precorrin-5B C(1)-methyltransferase [Entomobacter blattae]
MQNQQQELRRGWTTGACATAAAKSAYIALLTNNFPDPIEITLPSGKRVRFALAQYGWVGSSATAGVIKDAGDDPDVTHGALICATLTLREKGAGICFSAGEGVGTVTRPGLALPVGEPAINPVPRRMMIQALQEVVLRPDVEVKISIPGGEKIAQKTLNGRLGIVGGLSILGTTGIVIPFSCAAWIESIHRGVDVARAMQIPHLAASTGNMSEEGIKKLYALPEEALIDMGDFVGGVLKYVRQHPVPALTIAGGIAKITKLAQGFLDLHSKRGRVDLTVLAEWAFQAGYGQAQVQAISQANTVAEAFEKTMEEGAITNLTLGEIVAERAWNVAADYLGPTSVRLEVALFNRNSQCVARTGLKAIE